MKVTVSPGKPLLGEIALPGDKSISHRAILFSGLAEGTSQIKNVLVAGVTRVMLGALSSLGVAWEMNQPSLKNATLLNLPSLTVQGCGFHGLLPPTAPIHCGNSATTMRLLTGALAAAGLPAVLDGSPGLRRRPMNRIVDPLRQMGVPISATNGHAPLVLNSRPAATHLSPLDYSLPVASAQVKTCLLLAALAAIGPTTIHEPSQSRDHTERLLSSMGVTLHRIIPIGKADGRHSVTLNPPAGRLLAPLTLTVPGDFSSAAFLMVAALITPGSEIRLRQVGLNPTRTGLLDALSAMGADIQITGEGTLHGEPVGNLSIRHSPLEGTQIRGDLVVRMIDEFPIFAVAAAYAKGSTTVAEATELRHKESDRISALCRELRALGVEVEEAMDGFTITGGIQPRGGTVNAQGDHRLAMSFVVAGLATRESTTIHHAEMIAESYPAFFETLRNLGASLQLDPNKTKAVENAGH